MIELFKKEIEINDIVELFLTTGKEIVGEVLEIGSNHILIKNEDGNTTRIFEVLLGGWKIIKDNKSKIESTEEQDVKEFVQKDNEKESTEEQDVKEFVQKDNEKESTEELDVKESIEEETFSSSRLGLKIKGKISLDKFKKKTVKIPIGRTYRLRQITQKLDLSISDIFIILEKEEIKIEKNPNFKIDQKSLDILEEYKNNPTFKVQEVLIKTNSDNSNLGLKLNSLTQLNQLKEKIDINIGKQILPGNAKIKRYFSDRHYGFLTDNNGFDYYFNYSDIPDKTLLNKLQNPHQEGVQVICQLVNIYGKPKAKLLYLPQSVESFQKEAEVFFESRDYSYSEKLLDIILNNFPDYSKSILLKKDIHNIKKNVNNIQHKNKTYYFLAKIENKKGNNELAKKLYYQAIEAENRNSEYAIKELAYLLSGESKYDEAIDLVKKYSNKIHSSEPNSFIAYFYEAKKDYKNAINYLIKIKSKTQIEDIKLAKRLAICYFGIGNYNIAEEQITKVLKIRPKDTVTNKLRQALDIAKAKGSEEEIESIFKEAEISTLTGGLSKYIYYTLEKCEYTGLTVSEVSEGNFNKKTLTKLKDYIKSIKAGRPRERAEAFLTQAKIEQIIDSENTKEINSSLAKYCTSIATSWANDNRHVDSLRYYILEAAALESDSYDYIARYLPIYLHSFTLSSFESGKKIDQKLIDSINEVISNNTSHEFWIGILDLLLVNSAFSTRFLTLLYKNSIYHKTSLDFLFPFLNENKAKNISKELFLKLWSDSREKLKREKEIFSAKVLSLTNSKTTEIVIEYFQKLMLDLPNWIGKLDKRLINTLNDIIETIIEFNKQESFEDKERSHNITSNQLSQLKDDILASPTEISFNNYIQVIDSIRNLIDEEFKTVIETSRPIINVKIYGEGSLNETTGLVDVQFSISNKKGSAPISYLELNINDENGIEFIKENNIINQTLKGGEEKILKLKVKVKSEIVEEGATNLKINYSYKIRGNEEMFNQKEELTLRFYSISDFIKIENPFAATADSGPVEDISMFFGRDDFISGIKESITKSKSKCVIVYGQKRSGKSSVLHHLRESLNNTPNTFCISFSLGEIIEDLSPKTFYYTILTEIEDSLAIMSEENENIPNYKAPDYKDLDEVPTLIFNKQIKLLKREFKKNQKWSNKKLVLLIDEFTYIYTAIQKKYLSEQFMKTWKSFLEKGFFTSVLIGQDIMPKFKAAYPNEFGVTEDKRLSYLKRNDAINLIERPIWDETKNRSRFLGKATDLILDYTSSNPYYVQIFCARLVDYMNEIKAISVTEADVHDIAHSFIKGEQSLTADKFDNLITAGDADLDAFDPNDVLSALKHIAIASKNLDSCSRDVINLGEVDYEESILKDLKDREVLSSPQPGYFKINVRLFKEWLLVN